MLTHAQIEARLPQAGSMVLLDRLVRFDQDGLQAAGISGALDDEFGDMWFSFVSGIVRVSRQERQKVCGSTVATAQLHTLCCV